MRQKLKWEPVVPIARTHRQGPDELAHELQPALLALQAARTSSSRYALADKRSPTRQVLSATATAPGPQSSEREAPC